METTTTRRNVSAVTDIRIGHIIKRERERKRLTLAELATAIDCKHPTLSNYESGRRTLPEDRVEPLAKILGLDPRFIDPDAA
ncbi:helix-turn-helix domain-containing protein [Arthrobacter sp. 2RAF6]|uniref:helix-turn-helix domain-containing protein n=1 Tax=Arthrobacter sp. 2RAF6 TaxID=3233002 RepID=UPI003F902FBC